MGRDVGDHGGPTVDVAQRLPQQHGQLAVPESNRQEFLVKEFLVKEFLVKEFLVKEFIVKEFLVKEFLIKEFLVKEFLLVSRAQR